MSVDVSDVLDQIIKGEKSSKAELEAVAKAAAALRHDFITDAFRSIRELPPGTVEFEGFKNCLKSMSDHLMAHGFLTVSDTQLIWLEIQEVER